MVGFIDAGNKPGISRTSCRVQKSVNAVSAVPDAVSSGHLYVLTADAHIHVFRPSSLASTPIP